MNDVNILMRQNYEPRRKCQAKCRGVATHQWDPCYLQLKKWRSMTLRFCPIRELAMGYENPSCTIIRLTLRWCSTLHWVKSRKYFSKLARKYKFQLCQINDLIILPKNKINWANWNIKLRTNQLILQQYYCHREYSIATPHPHLIIMIIKHITFT